MDSFQGREAEAVVISTVRSNDKQSMGFWLMLQSERGDSCSKTCLYRGRLVTVGGDPFLNRLMSHMRTNGLVATANEFGELHQRTP